MRNNQRQLKSELRRAGASETEAGTLLPIARDLRLLGTGTRTARVRHGFARRANVLKGTLLTISGAIAGAVIIIFSQSAGPTSWLYPVQQLSDNAAIMIRPEYRATVMMRRAQQVNDLVASHAPAGVIMATLDNYNAEAAGYKAMTHTDYAAFEYCQANLSQAAASAPATIRHAITESLNSLDAS